MKTHTFETYQKHLIDKQIKYFEIEPIAKLGFAFYSFIVENYMYFIDDCGLPYSTSSINFDLAKDVMQGYASFIRRVRYLNQSQLNYFISEIKNHDFTIVNELKNVKYFLEYAERYKPENIDLFSDEFKTY